jgi:hypothetical protein
VDGKRSACTCDVLAWPRGEGSAAANFRLRLNDVSIQQVNDLMEAIHEGPAMLMNWDSHDLDELRTHLDCFRTLPRFVMDADQQFLAMRVPDYNDVGATFPSKS